MKTLRETLYAILAADAQSTSEGSLGSMLGKYEKEPYGVYFMNPPQDPALPCLTYFFNAKQGKLPRSEYVNITAYGDDYEAILSRVKTLVEAEGNFDACQLFVVQHEWDWSSPDRYDEDLNAYYRQDRFKIKVIDR